MRGGALFPLLVVAGLSAEDSLQAKQTSGAKAMQAFSFNPAVGSSLIERAARFGDPYPSGNGYGYGSSSGSSGGYDQTQYGAGAFSRDSVMPGAQQQLVQDTRTMQNNLQSASDLQRQQQLQQLQQLQRQLQQSPGGQGGSTGFQQGSGPQIADISVLDTVNNRLAQALGDTSSGLNSMVNSELMKTTSSPDYNSPPVTDLVSDRSVTSGFLSALNTPSSGFGQSTLFDSIAKEEASLKAMAVLIEAQTQKIKENEATAAKMTQLNVINKTILKKNKAALKVAGERLLATVTSFTTELSSDNVDNSTGLANVPTSTGNAASSSMPTPAPSAAATVPTVANVPPTVAPANKTQQQQQAPASFVERSARTKQRPPIKNVSPPRISREHQALAARLRSLIELSSADEE